MGSGLALAARRFLALYEFARTNRRATVMMFVRLSICLSVCLSVCPSRTGVHCDHTVHVIADLSSWFDSPMFWAPYQYHVCPPSPSRLLAVSPGTEVVYGYV